MTIKNITASFSVTGVCPFNRNALSQLPSKKQASFQPDQLPLQTGLAYIPMYSPAPKVSSKLPHSIANSDSSQHSVPSKQVSSISTHESHDVTSALLQNSGLEENVVVKPAAVKEKATCKPSTAISKFLETPTHPSKYPTKNPKSCGRVLTSLENMQKMEEKEIEKQRKLQEKANRKATKELKLKDKTKKKEDSKQSKVQGKSSKKNGRDFATKCTIQAGCIQTRSQKAKSSG